MVNIKNDDVNFAEQMRFFRYFLSTGRLFESTKLSDIYFR